MSIDTRYSPQPSLLRVPLYPLQIEFPFPAFWRKGRSSALRMRIAEALNCPDEACFLSTSARIVLIHFLTWLRQERGHEITVALPAFFCPHTAHELLSAGFMLVLLDIDDSFRLTPESLSFAKEKKCDVLIWPDLFIGRNAPPDLGVLPKDVVIVRDVAQTFPLARPQTDPSGHKQVVLFSFGPNKFLAGQGGGGLALQDKALQKGFASYVKSLPLAHSQDSARGALRTWRGALCKRFALHQSIHWGLLPSLGLDQRDVLETQLANSAHSVSKNWPTLPERQACVILRHWDRWLRVQVPHKNNVVALLALLTQKYGPSTVSALEQADIRCTIVLRIPAAQRHTLAALFASKGVQTTWYYYPLTHLSAFAGCCRQKTPVSERLAGEVLILPFSWAHTEKGMAQTLLTIAKDLN